MSINSIIDKIFTNWQAKLLSFGLAVLLYAAFQIITLDTKAFSIPLQIRDGGNYVLVENAPEFVRVELQGASQDIATVQASNITAFIDISHISKPGTDSIAVGLDLAENLTLMEPLEINVTPALLHLNFEENAVAWVPVEPSFAGSPLAGYEVLSWESSLKDVKIAGPKSVVDSTLVVYADGVDLNDKMYSFAIDAPLLAVNSKVDILTSDTTSVFVEIAPQIVTLLYENLVPTFDTLLTDFAIAQPLTPINVELTGEKNPLELFIPGENFIEVDFSQISEIGVYTLPILVNIPQGFTLESISATEVSVEIIEAPAEEINELTEDLLIVTDDSDVLAEELE